MTTKYEVAAIAAINGLDNGESHKLTASQQKEMFGFVVAGRKDITFNPADQGTVIIGHTVTGKDYVSRDYTYEEFAAAINNRQQVEAW